MNHCLDAYGIILKDKYVKWKCVYSGDTTPCDKLAIAGNQFFLSFFLIIQLGQFFNVLTIFIVFYTGKNCTLLIHEATMEDELLDEAIFKRHWYIFFHAFLMHILFFF